MSTDLIPKAKELLEIERESQPDFQPTTTWLQRFLRIGYQTATSLMDELERVGLKAPAAKAEQVASSRQESTTAPIDAEIVPPKTAKDDSSKGIVLKNKNCRPKPPTAGDDESPHITAAKDDEDRIHSDHSPSSLKNKAICPGWRNDPDSDKTAANRGVLGHKATELEDPKVCGDDDDLAVAAVKCISYVDELRKKLEVGAAKGISKLPGGAKLPLNPIAGMVYEYTEIRVDFDGEWGFFDKLFIDCDASTAHLLDHKFAWNFYEADSPQFWAYIFGILNAVPWLENVVVHVLHPFRNEIDVESYDVERMNGSIAKVIAIVTRARKNDPAEYLTGPHCEHCGARLNCPKINALAIQVARDQAGPELVIPTQLLPENITDPAMMAHAKLLAPVLEKWAGQVAAYALAMARGGQQIKDEDAGIFYLLKERNAKFSITNAAIAYSVVEPVVSAEEFASCSTTAIGSLEKIYATNAVAAAKEKKEKLTKKDAMANLRSLLLDAACANNEGTVYYLDRIKNTGGAIEDSSEEGTLLT